MSLPPEVRTNYVAIIDSILAASNIEEVSEKRIRRGIQDSVQYDITPQKAAIKALILERFDVFAERAGIIEDPTTTSSEAPVRPATNGHHTPSRDVSMESKTASPVKREARPDEMPSEDTPPKKKLKPTSAEDDAALAARLQAEENKLSRATRGTATRRAAPVKKRKQTPKKQKSSKKIKDNSDDESDDSDGSVEKPVRNTGFHKPLNLSPALSELLGESSLSRPQTTKKIWEYIKSRDLQDPSDKRHILCDEKMRAVFKVDRVHMFTMTKILNQQMYNPEE